MKVNDRVSQAIRPSRLLSFRNLLNRTLMPKRLEICAQQTSPSFKTAELIQLHRQSRVLLSSVAARHCLIQLSTYLRAIYNCAK
ncbi:hypothetical protein PGT21_007970 [Puccinia graminis f. sp. tritici]|uniref:Uncharacterized protein n=1 Tax=Puccinia graminis f. sp. tritici TaxID=56615 RepID=A0A5B0QAA2_PUCGR|nr:hypothetical protein PGT21_007970 [Puccinia graminis f. sp. tritici]